MSHQCARAVNDTSLHVICYEGKFDQLPDEVRHRGPWQGLKHGDVGDLKLEYREALARQCYVVVYQPAGAFMPEHG